MRRIEDFSVTNLDGTSHHLVRAYFPLLLEEKYDDDENDPKQNNKQNQALPDSGCGGLGVLLFSHGGGGVVGSIVPTIPSAVKLPHEGKSLFSLYIIACVPNILTLPHKRTWKRLIIS